MPLLCQDFQFPDITGSLYAGWEDNTAPGLIFAGGSKDWFGALYPTIISNHLRSTYAASHVTDTTGKYLNTIGFQAKKSNSKYRLTTVQPPALQTLIIIKI